MACWISLSTTFGMPSNLSPPPSFGIVLRRTGDGLVRPIQELLPNAGPVFPSPSLELLDRHAVRTGEHPGSVEPDATPGRGCRRPQPAPSKRLLKTRSRPADR